MNGPPRVVRRSASGENGAPPRKRSRGERGEPAALDTQLPPPPGRLRNITLKNFMCHEHLSLDLNERINFIKGQNGSGKSAVLTGVMVGLGARAATTDRGSSVKGLIRTGQRQAVIALTLDNSGEYAYAPEKYGATITIERTLKDTGSGSYKIGSEREPKLRKMVKGELQGILDGLSIQVDNPLVILTQETSKNFLRGEDPKKKYQLFQEATRLSHIARLYDEIRKNGRVIGEALEYKEQTLRKRRELVKEYEREANLHKNREAMQLKISTLKTTVLWAKVIEEEKALEKVKEEERKKKEELQRLFSKKQELEEKVEEQNGPLAERRARLEKERAAAAAAAQQHESRLKELRKKRAEAERDVHRAREGARRAAEDRDVLRAEIDRQRRETQPDYEAESRRRQEARSAVQERLHQLTAEEKARAAHLQQVTGSVRQQREQLRAADDEAREVENKIRELDNQLNMYRHSQTNPRSVFGAWVEAVDRDIETAWQQRQFRKKPIGPVGAYVRLKAGCEEWKPLVETCLAGVLRAYLVDDQRDLAVMSAILRKHTSNEREKPKVIASKFLGEIHDVSRNGIDTSGDFVSAWSVLDIENPVVANAVIDQTRAESVLLLRTDAEARNLLSYRARVPRGCAQALTRAGFRYYPDPGYRTYPVNVPRQARYLQVSVQDVISDVSRQLQERRDEAQEVTARRAPAHAALAEAQRQERDAKRLLDETRRNLGEARAELREIDSHEDPEPVNLRALEEEVTEMERKMDEEQALVGPLTDKLQAVTLEEEDCRKVCAESRHARDHKIQQLEQLKSDLEVAESLRTKLQKLSEFADARRGQLAEVSGRAREQEQRTREVTDVAAAAGERTNTTKSVRELEARINGLSRSLQDEATRPRLSAEEAAERFQAAQLECQQAEEAADTQKRALDTLNRMLDERERALTVLRYSKANRVTTVFGAILEARAFGGGIHFEHDRQRLEMAVGPGQAADGAGGGAARATCQLSGGERSFSTIAFLMAMWSVMPSPFRMLDEYDVFMDEANRRLGHDMLVTNALALKSQFAFFTPLSVPASHDGDDRVLILRMAAPDRRGH